MLYKYASLVIVSWMLINCGGNDENLNEIVCTANLVPGIEVELRDAVTDLPIAENAIVMLTADNYQEQMIVSGYENSDPASAYLLAGAWERPGIYTIDLTLSGYQSWQKSDVEVIAGICHVSTVRYTVRLDKQN